MKYITKGVLFWLVVSLIIVIIDASYILLRPHTLEGGKYFQFYSLYRYYIPYDSLYGNSTDFFVVIVAWLNLAEVVVTGSGLLLSISNRKSWKLTGAILAILGSAFVFWKTVIYCLYDVQYLNEAARTFQPDAIALYYIPNGFWIVCPIWAIISISARIGKDVLAEKAKAKKN